MPEPGRRRRHEPGRSAHDLPDRLAERVAQQRGHQRVLALVVVGCGDDAAHPIGRVAEHDHAGRGHVAHAQLRDAAQRELLVERAVEQLARLGQQRGPREQPLALRLAALAGA